MEISLQHITETQIATCEENKDLLEEISWVRGRRGRELAGRSRRPSAGGAGAWSLPKPR
jgi:hypothetical protein